MVDVVLAPPLVDPLSGVERAVVVELVEMVVPGTTSGRSPDAHAAPTVARAAETMRTRRALHIPVTLSPGGTVQPMPFTIRRPAARCVLLDAVGRIFLIRAEDPIDPHKPEWLEVPGGGIGYGEDSATACRRELREETGIVDVEIGPCIWTQHVEYTFAGFRFESDDQIHVAWCDGGIYAPKGLEALEADAFISATWWTLTDLLGTDEPTVPVRLREFLPAVVAGEIPNEPIDITPQGPVTRHPGGGRGAHSTPDRTPAPPDGSSPRAGR